MSDRLNTCTATALKVLIEVLTIGRSCSLRNSGLLSLRRSLRKRSRVMMTAVMMKADTKPARRGSNVGDSWAIVAGTKNTHISPKTSCTPTKQAGTAWLTVDLTLT